MIAYFVHDPKKDSDLIILPEMGCSVPVDTERMLEFISVQPEFAKWSGDACGMVSPEDFGTVVASRDDMGDVDVLDSSLWQARMHHHLINT